MKLSRDSNRVSLSLILVLVITALGITGCWNSNNTTGPDPDPDSDPEKGEKTVKDVVKEDNDLTTFAKIMVDAGLEAKLSNENSHTVFAPKDSAFSKLPDGFIDSLSKSELREVLNYHMVSKLVEEGDFSDESALETDQGDYIYVQVGSNNIKVNNEATLTETDKTSSNGVIQKVDQVFMPDDYLSVFGIIQKRFFLEKFACHCTSGRTNLDEVLKNDDSNFTVFVPTDQAFRESGLNTNDLSDAELKKVLNYHIVEGKKLSDQLSDGQTLATKNGEELRVSVDSEGNISLNEGTAVQQVDIEGSNGVVFVIDSVLLPSE